MIFFSLELLVTKGPCHLFDIFSWKTNHIGFSGCLYLMKKKKQLIQRTTVSVVTCCNRWIQNVYTSILRFLDISLPNFKQKKYHRWNLRSPNIISRWRKQEILFKYDCGLQSKCNVFNQSWVYTIKIEDSFSQMCFFFKYFVNTNSR